MVQARQYFVVFRSFTICAKSPEEKDEWLKVLRETIAENDAKKKSFIQLEAEPGSPESPVINVSNVGLHSCTKSLHSTEFTT